MKELTRKLWMDFQFLFPCIANAEINGDEATVETETDLLRLYPVKKRVDGMVSLGEDFWGRETFKDKNEQYYCEVDGVLHFVGSSPDNDPSHPVQMEIVEDTSHIDKELNEFKPIIEKIKKYASENDEIELIDYSYSLRDNGDASKSKIVGVFKFKIVK